ncbi:hypothetical protein BOTNAR_0457g00040 [Botryotinia narcissicola]|uniref:Uncharacterized protein n=1 Tax=Botryotinia narcissicola TaxID=278944 RepID=A0A4Z1HIG8_9HELO|nr:hypothetical protein BOTNAR_0457g00040 [Botryotinia narcissicola]
MQLSEESKDTPAVNQDHPSSESPNGNVFLVDMDMEMEILGMELRGRTGLYMGSLALTRE